MGAFLFFVYRIDLHLYKQYKDVSCYIVVNTIVIHYQTALHKRFINIQSNV